MSAYDFAIVAAVHAMQALFAPVGKISIDLLLKRDLSKPVDVVSPQIPVTIRQATEADLDQITLLYATDSYLYLGDEPAGPSVDGRPWVEPAARDQYGARMQRGEKCFLAVVGDEIAHTNWLCFTWAEAVTGHPLYLRAGEIYTTDAITVEKFRGQNIHALVLGEMLRYARGRGYMLAYTVTRIEYRGSFKAFRLLGWQVLGCLICLTSRRSGRSRLLKLWGRIDPVLRGPNPDGRDSGAQSARGRGT
jgi:GNAT superfamily N-acetyltransferase